MAVRNQMMKKTMNRKRYDAPWAEMVLFSAPVLLASAESDTEDKGSWNGEEIELPRVPLK